MNTQVDGRPADLDEVSTDESEQRTSPADMDLRAVTLHAMTPGRVCSVRTSISGSVKRTVAAPPSSSTIAAGVPSATTRPWSITTMRSHSRSASSTSWVTRTTVVPPSRIGGSRPTCAACRQDRGSGSARRGTRVAGHRRGRGRRTGADARPRQSPNERAPQAGEVPLLGELAERAGGGVQRGEQSQRLADTHLVGQGGVL